ncbi:hypothetical protein ARMSODRAFT_980365 [Armillaria solidipes]|uniref:Uncharacterized protein n=1 Tax=Armillaria solidipes TaxID=1076256 RepID=A0A2H3AZL8_9AGAR|nr:hypothetical protein ARMSODRAFT_980365 [Armillaria solidipes]
MGKTWVHRGNNVRAADDARHRGSAECVAILLENVAVDGQRGKLVKKTGNTNVEDVTEQKKTMLSSQTPKMSRSLYLPVTKERITALSEFIENIKASTWSGGPRSLRKRNATEEKHGQGRRARSRQVAQIIVTRHESAASTQHYCRKLLFLALVRFYFKLGTNVPVPLMSEGRSLRTCTSTASQETFQPTNGKDVTTHTTSTGVAIGYVKVKDA